MRSFVGAYAPERVLIVNRASHPDHHLGPTRIQFLRPWELPRAVRAILG